MVKKTDAKRFEEYLNRISRGNISATLDRAVRFSSKKKKKG